MNITESRTRRILEYLRQKHDIDYCPHYGERGYSAPDAGILFANWNDISERIQDYLTEAGFELEWFDEWYIDYNNDKAWRTSPNCYSWICSLVYADDGEVLTPDDGAEAAIDAVALTDYAQPIGAVPDWVLEADIESEGYVQINGTYESGWHPGQNDDLEKIAKAAFETGATSVLFRIAQSGQFDVHFQGFRK